MSQLGILVLLVGPSGVGKNTLLINVLPHLPGFSQMPTATTRLPRLGEVEGREHYYVTDAQFDMLIQDKAVVEWQIIHGKRYGTLIASLLDVTQKHKRYIADVDMKGAAAIKSAFPHHVVQIFVRPPSIEVLERRIRDRGGVEEGEIKTRLTRAESEMQYSARCDYVMLNDQLDRAVDELQRIVLDELRHRERI